MARREGYAHHNYRREVAILVVDEYMKWMQGPGIRTTRKSALEIDHGSCQNCLIYEASACGRYLHTLFAKRGTS